MKTILIAVVMQLGLASPDQPPAYQVMASVVADFDSVEACKNAATGLRAIGEASGFKANAMCVPKDIAKLEVEKPKPKRQNEDRAQPEPQRGTAS